MKIAIVGYGTAGQAAALFLARDGHAIELFERSAQLHPVGAGFLLQPTGLGVLDALGLREAALAHGARIERLHGTNAAGRLVMDMCYADLSADSFGLGMARGALFTLLHARCIDVARIHTGTRIVAAPGGSRGLVDDAGNEYGPYDLIVVADGSHSGLRAASDLVVRDPPYPWGAMWCLLPADGWPYANELRQRYDGTRRMLGVLPVGTHAGNDGDRQRWLTFYYSLPGARVDSFDAAALAQLQRDVAELWPELSQRTQALVEPAQLNRARYRDVVLRRPWREHTVFIGDAAHGMSPQLGQGVNMALLDAQALAVALAAHTDIADALAAYARERTRHVAIYQRLSRWLTPLFQSDSRVLAPLRDTFFHPLGRLPYAKPQMLKILAGTKRSWLH
jgi:2-polyprenyl-6-methoxyphenol hydroxylase-like FAD-dependent oxidoreductase